ncbi:hypothetical protein C4D60_Mb10t03180 [Musa balbisiana]|uniref:Uncharacterized protein n=1 Tax=Musa balbisiana TaxID=52838 RepID=A0A4S8IV48_MUSBA|nr:hypothetical protein C4D60_Mb10t03180 [Musa balbisiana]
MGPIRDPVAARTAETAPLASFSGSSREWEGGGTRSENKGADEYLTVRWNQASLISSRFQSLHTRSMGPRRDPVADRTAETAPLASLSASSREWEGGGTRAGKQRRR